MLGFFYLKTYLNIGRDVKTDFRPNMKKYTLPSRVAIYKISVDHGMAPNPFHGICTLALCTPNHQRSNIEPNDIIIGVTSNQLKGRFRIDQNDEKIIYCMQVDKRAPLNDYFNNHAYKDKKPDLAKGGLWAKGDNFYCNNEDGILVHLGITNDHTDKPTMLQDIYGDRVWISRRFTYWGRKAPSIPLDTDWGKRLYQQINQKLKQGVHYIFGGTATYKWDEANLVAFMDWLTVPNGFKGQIGLPFDFDEDGNDGNKRRNCGSYHTALPSTTRHDGCNSC